MHKLEREPRSREPRNTRIRGGLSSLRFVGIDVAAERHVVAVVDETGTILLRATPVTEDTPATVGQRAGLPGGDGTDRALLA